MLTSVEEAWLNIIRAVMQSRISNIPDNKIFEVLCNVDDYKDQGQPFDIHILVNLLMDRASIVLDQVFDKNPVSV